MGKHGLADPQLLPDRPDLSRPDTFHPGRERNGRRAHRDLPTPLHVAFKGLPLDALPPKLLRRIEHCLARVNAVLAHYTIATWDDYAKVSSEDLTKLGKLIHEIV